MYYQELLLYRHCICKHFTYDADASWQIASGNNERHVVLYSNMISCKTGKPVVYVPQTPHSFNGDLIAGVRISVRKYLALPRKNIRHWF